MMCVCVCFFVFFFFQHAKKTYSSVAVDEQSGVGYEVRTVVVDGSSFTFIDSMGLKMLSSVSNCFYLSHVFESVFLFLFLKY